MMGGAAITSLKVLERMSLPAPFGIVFRDPATATAVSDGLRITVEPDGEPELARRLMVTRSGVWTTTQLPGPPRSVPKPFRIALHDELGRFQPMAFTAELPQRGLFAWDGWSAHPPSLLAPFLGDLPPPDQPSVPPPAPRLEWIPLFSAPGRAAPALLAEIRCDIVEADGREAAWALVAASVGGQIRGLGLADAKGRALIHFAYPQRPPATLPASPPALSHFRWNVELAVYRKPLPADAVPAVPTLAAIFAQLNHPRTPLARIDPVQPLGPKELVLGRPLTIRTETQQGPSSSLVLGAE